jgi:hypothetical protein
VLSFDTVHALTTCLLHVQHDAPHGSAAAGLLGTLVLAQDHPVGPTGSGLRHLRLLQLPLLAGNGEHQSLPAALHAIADGLSGHDPAPDTQPSPGDGPHHLDDLDLLRAALHQPALRLIAWAVCYDDLLADNDADLAKVRRVEAVDVDGRVYQLSLHPNDRYPDVSIDDQPDPDDLPATHPPLARLATAAHPAQT